MSSVPPILVLHGALGSASQMAPVATALRALADVQVVEWPGHGDTPLGSARFSISSFADALARHIDTLHGVAPIAFGHSMGGYVALVLEARAPGTFAGIVTLGTKFDWTPETAEREAERLDPDTILAKVPKFADVLESRHRGAGGWQLLLPRTAALLRENAQSPALNPAQFARVSSRVLVAVGTRDDTVSWEETQTAARAMLNATSVQLADVAHPIERVPVDAVVELVRRMM